MNEHIHVVRVDEYRCKATSLDNPELYAYGTTYEKAEKNLRHVLLLDRAARILEGQAA